MAWLVNALLEVLKDLVYGAFVLITQWFTGTLTLSTAGGCGGDRDHGIPVVPFHVC